MNARDIIKAVLLDRGLCAEDFFSQLRLKHLVDARKDAARRMRDHGYAAIFIARKLKRNHTTVLFYLDEARQQRKRAKGFELWMLGKFAPHAAEVVKAVAQAEGKQPADVIAEWVAERAEYEARAKVRAA
jgi:hypothetical protein